VFSHYYAYFRDVAIFILLLASFAYHTSILYEMCYVYIGLE